MRFFDIYVKSHTRIAVVDAFHAFVVLNDAVRQRLKKTLDKILRAGRFQRDTVGGTKFRVLIAAQKTLLKQNARIDAPACSALQTDSLPISCTNPISRL